MTDFEYRVEKHRRCKEYGTSNGTRIRCTREKGHDGKHATQLDKELLLPWDRYSTQVKHEVLSE